MLPHLEVKAQNNTVLHAMRLSACAQLDQRGVVSYHNPQRMVSISEKLLLSWPADLHHVSAASETLCSSSALRWWSGSVMFMVELCDLKGLIQP